MKKSSDTENTDKEANKHFAESSTDKFHNRHDKIVKFGFSIDSVARGFLQDNLPLELKDNLNFETLKSIKTAFIDRNLKETFCYMAFDCKFNDSSKESAKLIILIEHQSSPDKLMAFRATHYVNCLLYNELNARKSNKQAKLPPAFALVLYHGRPKDYPHTTDLKECFLDPHNMMKNYFNHKVELINVHDYDDDELLQQKLHGVMSYALKHSRDQDLLEALIKLIESISTIDYRGQSELQFTQRIFEYLIGFKSINEPSKLVKHVDKLPNPIKGEVMTIAEQLAEILFKEKVEQRVTKQVEQRVTKQVEQRVEQEVKNKYEEKARQREEQALVQTAIKALKKGADISFVADITNFSIEKIQTIKAQHSL